jgi:D-glycero-alpha-D-manno-heptose 1-phosphate guanylyltransferase
MTTAIILAGGLGTRLKEKVNDLPKPMAPVNNEPFLAHLLNHLIDNQVHNIHMSVGYMHEKIISYFGYTYKSANISYSIEHEKLGTGGAFKFSLNNLNLNDDCLLLNGDSFFNIDLKSLLSFHKKNNSLFTLSLFEFFESYRYGEVSLRDSSSVVQLNEKSAINHGFANAGIYAVNPGIIDILNKYYETSFSIENSLINYLISNNYNVKAKKFKGQFIDIGIPQDYIKANKFFKSLYKG